MEIQAAVFGTKEHISTAITELDLATLLLELNEIPPVVALLEYAHGVFERQMGSEPPYTRQVERLLKEMEKRWRERLEASRIICLGNHIDRSRRRG